MFDDSLIQQLAAELNQSEKSGVQIEHFSKRFPGMTIEDGYRINRAWMALKLAEGHTVMGHVIPTETRDAYLTGEVARLDPVAYAPPPDHDAGIELQMVMDALASLSTSDREVLLASAYFVPRRFGLRLARDHASR